MMKVQSGPLDLDRLDRKRSFRMMADCSFSTLDDLGDFNFEFTDDEVAFSQIMHGGRGEKDLRNATWSKITTPRTSSTKRPAGMPKRPMSAYNAFFQKERSNIFKEHKGMIGFQDLGREIGRRWKLLGSPERRVYEQIAHKDTLRYNKELNEFEERRRKRFKSNAEPTPEKATTSSSAVAYKNPLQLLAGASEASSALATPHSRSSSVSSEVPDFKQNPPVPSGTEVTLADENGVQRKYKITYETYRMTKKQADLYMATYAQKQT